MISLQSFSKRLALILIGAISTLFQVGFSQGYSAKGNLQIDNLDGDFAGYDSLFSDEALHEQRLFAIGENHRFLQSNAKLNVKTFKYLHQKFGVNHLLIEFGYARGFFIDKYIATGDTSILKLLKIHSFKNYVEVYEKLREYQLTLNDSIHIHVHGVDLERFYGLSVCLLDYLLPDELDRDVEEQLRLDIETINALGKFVTNKKNDIDLDDPYGYVEANSFSEKNTLEPIIERFFDDPEAYKVLLDSLSFVHFNTTMQQLRDQIVWSDLRRISSLQAPIYRENYIYNTIKSNIISTDNQSKFLLQFGRMHTPVARESVNAYGTQFDNVVLRLAKYDDSPLKSKVVSIGCFYPNYGQYDNSDPLLKTLKNKSVVGGVTGFKLQVDSLDTEIYNLFDYAVINDRSQETDEIDIEWNDEETLTNQSFHFFLRSSGIEGLSNLKNALVSESLEIQQPSLIYGIAYSIHDNNGLYMDVEMAGARFARVDNSSTFINLNYFSFMNFWGKDMAQNNKILLAPTVGIGGGVLSMDYEDKVVDQTGAFGEDLKDQVHNYRNGAFLLGSKVVAQLHLGKFMLGCDAGYWFDPSNKKWKLDGKRVSDSPKTSLSQYYFTGLVGLSF